MGRVRADRIAEYLCGSLSRALRNDYRTCARETLATRVAKSRDVAPDSVNERGSVETPRGSLGDPDPSVAANGAAALREIAETSGRGATRIRADAPRRLSAARNERAEREKVFVLDSLAKYKPADEIEVDGVVERATPLCLEAPSRHDTQDKKCFLIRNALDQWEQTAVFADIWEGAKTADNSPSMPWIQNHPNHHLRRQQMHSPLPFQPDDEEPV